MNEPNPKKDPIQPAEYARPTDPIDEPVPITVAIVVPRVR